MNGSERGFLFENVSGEEIPAFAVMQVVGNPADWDARLLGDELNDFVKETHKISGAQALFDNEVKLFCDKPSVVSEFLQDAGTIAFNGPSPVAKGKSGRCTWGHFPVAVLTNQPASGGVNRTFMITRESWELKYVGSNIGAYRGVLALEGKPSGDYTNIGLVRQTAHQPERRRMFARGTWATGTPETTGRDPNDPIELIVTELDEESGSDLSIGFEDTLMLLTPGLYTIKLAGLVYRAEDTPLNLESIPYKLRFITWDGNTGVATSRLWQEGEDGRIPYATATLLRHTVGTAPDVTYTMDQHEFTLVESFHVTEPTYILGLQQVGSSYIAAGGTFTVEYNYEEWSSGRGFFYGNNAYGWGGYWGGYGYWGSYSFWGSSYSVNGPWRYNNIHVAI